jgi:molybdopterin-guanine dinucleotide biosynthesis adapter protein
LTDIKHLENEQNAANVVIARSKATKQSSFLLSQKGWIASLAMTVGMPVLENKMKVIGLAGWSGAGKTTLLARLIPHFKAEGLRVSVIKHAHHSFDVDVPGKDSWVHREAGAFEVLVSSGKRWALMHELRGAAEPRLPELLAKLSPVDLVVVEGFKSEPHRKIEVHRMANGKPLLFPDDPAIAGIATDGAIETALPTAHLDDIPAIAAMMLISAIPVADVLAKSPIET